MTTAARNRRLRQNPLPARARVIVGLVVCLPILAFVAIVCLRLVKLSHAIDRDLGPIVASVLHQTLGHEFVIGKIETSPGQVTIENIVVSSKPTWRASHGEAGLRVRSVTIRYDLPGLIHDPQNAAHYVESIVADHPIALIERYSQKRFNFTDLIKKKKRKHAKPFLAKIEIDEGTLYFRDDTAPRDSLGRAPMNVARHVNGNVDCDSDQIITFEATAVGGERFASGIVHGQVSRKQPIQYNVDASVTDGDAPYWTHYLRLVPQARVLAGRGNVRFSILVPPSSLAVQASKAGAPIVIAGAGTVHDGAVRWLDRRFIDAPIRGIAGRFRFTNTEAAVAGSATLEGQNVDIAGTVGFTPTQPGTASYGPPVPMPIEGRTEAPQAPGMAQMPPPPTLALTLQSPSVDLARLAAAFPKIKIPKGIAFSRAAARVTLMGPATDPIMSGDVEAADIAYAGNRITGVRANIEYAHKIVGITSDGFGVDGIGRGSVVASVDLTQPKLAYTASGHVDDVDLASLHLPPGPVGSLPSHRSPMAVPPISGTLTADFIAEADGASARVTSNVTVSGGRVAHIPLPWLRGRVIWSERRSIELDKVAVDAAGGRALVSGTVSLNTPSPNVALSVNAAGIHLAQAIGPFTRMDAGGIAYFNGLVDGPLDDPTATGAIDLFRAHYDRFDADIVRGDLTASRNSLKIHDLHIDRYPAEADVAGTITGLSGPNPQVALKASVRGAQLEDITPLLGESGRQQAASLLPKGASPEKLASAFSGLAGELDGAFSIGGRLRQPALTGHVDLKDVTAGGNHIDTAQADIAATDQQVRISRIVIRAGKATATGDLAWWPHTGKIQAVAAGSEIELYRFRAYYGQYADLRGVIDFSGSLAGTLAAPTVTFGIVGSDLTIDGQRLAQFTGFGRYADGVLASDSGPWEFTTLVPGAPGTTTSQPVTYSIDSFELALPQGTNRNHAAPRITLTAHIPADAPEHLTHLIDTLRQSKFADTPGVSKLIAAYDRLPKPADAVIDVPKLAIDGSLAELKIDASVSLKNAVCGLDHASAVDASVRFDTATHATDGSLTATDLLIHGVPLTRISVADASYANRILNVSQFRASYEDGFVEADGRADLDGAISADLDASNIPLSMFDALMPKSRALLGKVGTLAVRATGPTRTPNLQASISIANPEVAYRTPAAKGSTSTTTVAAYSLDEIRGEAISVTTPKPGGSQVLTIDDLTALRNGKPVAAIQGSVPFHWNDVSGSLARLPADQPLHAKIVIDDLSVLAFATPVVDPTRTSGVLTATVDANDPAMPEPFVGSVKIAGASIGFDSPPTAQTPAASQTPSSIDTYLKNIDATIAFDDTHAVVQSFTGESSVKGGFAITGSSTFHGKSNLDLKMALNAFQIDEHTRQSIVNRLYDSSVQGKITGTLSITGPFRAPILANASGTRIAISDASMDLPSPPSTPGETPPSYPVDPRFDLRFAMGTDRKPVNVKKTLLNADVYGTADLTGKFSAPALDASLTITGGRVVLFGPVLRIQSGATVTLRYPVANPDTSPGASPYIMSEDVHDLVATTTISASLAQVSQYSSSFNSEEMISPAAASTMAAADTQRTDYHITVKIDGPLATAQPEYSSEPFLERQQILALLTQQNTLMGILRGGSGSGDVVTQELASVVNSVGAGMLLNPVESNIAEALGLSSFSIDYAPDAPVDVAFTAPLGHRFEASFLRAFGPREPSVVNSLIVDPEYLATLSYKLTNLLRVSISRDDLGDNIVGLEGVIYLDRPRRDNSPPASTAQKPAPAGK